MQVWDVAESVDVHLNSQKSASEEEVYPYFHIHTFSTQGGTLAALPHTFKCMRLAIIPAAAAAATI